MGPGVGAPLHEERVLTNISSRDSGIDPLAIVCVICPVSRNVGPCRDEADDDEDDVVDFDDDVVVWCLFVCLCR